MPSVVAFVGGDRLVGEAAKNQASANPTQTVFDVKRFIGKQFSDPTVQKDMKAWPFKIVDMGGKPMVEIEKDGQSKFMAAEEISAMVLRKLKEQAEAYLGTDVKNAVITVPAHFTDAQRQATKDAGAIAGLTVLRLVNEPTAAALAYGMDKVGDKTIVVYDFGGGTLDVSMVKIQDGSLEVQQASGDMHLGGEDFDQRVTDYLAKSFQKKSGKDISQDTRAMQQLRLEAEKAKRRLSATHQAPIRIEGFVDGVDLKETLSRASFEKLNGDLWAKAIVPLSELEGGGMQKAMIDEIVLVGGSTRVPKVQALVKAFFDGKELTRGINPDEAIAYGAAIQAGMLGGQAKEQEMLISDVTPLSLGIETVGGLMTPLITRNTALPAKNKTVFTTHFDNQPGLKFQVYEGERAFTKNNHLLGKFQIRGIAPAPRGKPQIEVTFEVDANGILTVEAQDVNTAKSEKVTIADGEGRLTPSEIEEMLKQAEAFAEEDAKLRERVDAKVSLDVYLASLLKLAEEDSEGSQADREQAITAAKEARDWLAANPEAEADEIREKRQEVEGTAGPLASATTGSAASTSQDAVVEPSKEEEMGHDEL
eukprot:TRINITY_DN43249_c0_g1_i1.p1 TRINITY_DN43249_c0_g1~~TRINITY_DN43249_c0_g1_i1.p1  ORF type:complete len:693 (+),score=167.55 TRINITY_DN43249_c0_g1_i1:305-2080(+)